MLYTFFSLLMIHLHKISSGIFLSYFILFVERVLIFRHSILQYKIRYLLLLDLSYARLNSSMFSFFRWRVNTFAYCSPTNVYISSFFLYTSIIFYLFFDWIIFEQFFWNESVLSVVLLSLLLYHFYLLFLCFLNKHLMKHTYGHIFSNGLWKIWKSGKFFITTNKTSLPILNDLKLKRAVEENILV